jgi:hypothetical protein
LRQQIKPQINNFEPTYNAHGQTRAAVAFIRGGKVLSAKGVLSDKIDGLSGTRHWTDDFDNIGDEADIRNSKFYKNPYGTDDGAYVEALWRALIGNRGRLGEDAPQSHSSVLDSAILASSYAPPIPCPSTGDSDESLRWNLHLWMKRNANFILGGKPLKDHLSDTKTVTSDPELYHQSIGRQINFLWSRRLVTTEGGYIGVAPRPVQHGDVIAVLFGCSAPLVLRADSSGARDTYEIVAECYVHGIMDGEVPRGSQEGKYRIEHVLISRGFPNFFPVSSNIFDRFIAIP